MATISSQPPGVISDVAPRRPLPPLAQGDRLTRAEFLQRSAGMPPHIKAERIEGMVYMPAAAVSAGFHGDPHAIMIGWLFVYAASTPGVAVSDNSTILLDMDNDPQPDGCLRILSSHGGVTRFDAEKYIKGAPELIVEITASSLSYDLGAKMNAYRRNGVREYVVHRTYDGEVDWFLLRDGQYVRQSPDAEGICRSEVFPGLWMKPGDVIEGKLPEILATLQRGIATPEHAEFVKGLG